MIERRFGRFQIAIETIHERPDLVLEIMKNVIVFEAGPGPGDYIWYKAYHPSFDLVPIGTDVPLYQCDVLPGPQVEWTRSIREPWQSEKFAAMVEAERMRLEEGPAVQIEGEINLDMDHPDDPFPKYPLRKVTR